MPARQAPARNRSRYVAATRRRFIAKAWNSHRAPLAEPTMIEESV